MSEMSPGETGDLGHELVRLASADNFRDLAGPGHRSADGTPLRPGVLYRSNELQLSDADVHRLAGLGLGEIFDLREQHEVDAHPDIEVAGASWHHLPVPGIPMDQVVALSSREEADEAMRAVYRGFVDDELVRRAPPPCHPPPPCEAAPECMCMARRRARCRSTWRRRRSRASTRRARS